MKKHLYKTKEKKSLQSALRFYSDHFLESENVDENKVTLSLLNYTKRNGECKSQKLAYSKKRKERCFIYQRSLRKFKEIYSNVTSVEKVLYKTRTSVGKLIKTDYMNMRDIRKW